MSKQAKMDVLEEASKSTWAVCFMPYRSLDEFALLKAFGSLLICPMEMKIEIQAVS